MSHRLVALLSVLLLESVASAPMLAQDPPAAAAIDHRHTEAGELPFKDLFDGKSIDSWIKRGGGAAFRVEDGAIVGTSKANSPNTFLCPPKDYSDFVLEYEILVHPKFNSGVQIRSRQNAVETVYVSDSGEEISVPAGRVHGYQVELDADKTERSWMAGIYDESRRGWLYPGKAGGDPTAFTLQGQKLYRPREWNKIRVIADGDRIQTYLNGHLRADMTDSMTPSGFIGLQVPVVATSEPLWAKWRNLRIAELPAAVEQPRKD